MVAALNPTAPRTCDASSRIPTNRFPVFSTTVEGQIAVGDFEVPAPGLSFEAERDVLLSDLSARVVDSVTHADVPALITIEYCDTTYVDGVDVQQYGFCCDRKPGFLVGVRENKRIRFTVRTIAAVAVNPANVELTLNGMQGNGCCG